MTLFGCFYSFCYWMRRRNNILLLYFAILALFMSCHEDASLFHAFYRYCLWCTGLSLKSQELTAIFLAVRLYCSFVMEYDIHTLLDLATFATTLWVIYMIRFKLKSSYMEEKDNFAIYYVVGSPTILSFQNYKLILCSFHFTQLQRLYILVRLSALFFKIECRWYHVLC